MTITALQNDRVESPLSKYTLCDITGPPLYNVVQLTWSYTPLHRFSSRLFTELNLHVFKAATTSNLSFAILSSPPMHLTSRLTSAIIFAAVAMAASSYQPTTVTRVATFRFKEDVTAEQKGDRARAFLGLYEAHQELLVGMPKGGKPLNTPLNLTNVKRDSIWDMGFTVTFKVSYHL